MSYKSLLESSKKTDAQIEESHLDSIFLALEDTDKNIFLDNIFLTLEDTDKNIKVMQESIDSNKKDIREMLDRIKELVVDAR